MVGIFTFCCGRWSISENPERKPQCFAIPQGGCRRWFFGISQESVRGSFFTPWGQVGGQFFLCPYSRRNTGGSRRGYLRISGGASCQEKKQVCVRTSSETQQLVKEMCPLDSCRLLFKLAVELDMVMNALAAGMEIPDEQLRTLRSRCIQDVKNRRQYLAG